MFYKPILKSEAKYRNSVVMESSSHDATSNSVFVKYSVAVSVMPS